jgi:hypothetical protein
MIRLLTICFALVAIVITCRAQNTPILERTITISFRDESLADALKKLADAGGFDFSYNTSLINGRKTITADYKNQTVREILDQLFTGEVEYKVRSKHIILSKVKTSGKDQNQVLKGYVVDDRTGERLKDVTVYEPLSLTSAVTNAYGYFEIKMNKAPEDLKLVVNSENYTDTLVNVRPRRGRLINIPLRINKEKITTKADSLAQKLKRFWKTQIMNPKNRNLVNVTDTLYRQAQFSLVPFVGTNHRLSGNVINDYSFNMIGGYSLGVRKAELGGVFNLDRGDVEIVQLAGAFNTVAGKMSGVQVAGIFNANFGGMEGAQAAGIANINWNSSRYFSVAGVMNFTRISSEGVHIAGVGNFTLGQQKGPHTAGLFNFSTGDAGPLNVAGLMNFTAKNSRGLQLSGLLNFTGKNHKGAQITGALNFTGKKLSGTQIGLVNYATKVNGGQLGLINVTDSINGIPIGLFSIVLKGYHKFEISADEIFYTNIAFRSGVRQFYNIFTAGAKPETFEEDYTFWTFGYGIGTARKIARWLYLNIDATANQVVDQQKIEKVHLLNKLYLGFDVQATRHFSLTFGATLNGYVTKNDQEYAPLFTKYEPSIIHERDFGSRHLQMWWGGKVGLRFL